MKYFLLRADPVFVTSPQIINWFETLDIRNIHPASAHKIPRRILLWIRANPATLFTDIVSSPCLLFSKLCKDVVSLYEPAVKYKQVTLLDGQNGLAALYYMPILPVIDCLDEASEFNLDKSLLRRAVLDESKIGDCGIFRAGGVKNAYTVVRMDLVESLLRRGAVGIGLTTAATKERLG